MTIRTISAIIGLLAAASLAGQTTPADSVYTLEECRRMALESNADIHTAENNLRAAIETRREAFTKYFPEISGTVSAFQANHDILQYTVLDLVTLGVIKKGKAAGIWALQPVFMGGQIVNGNKLAKVGEDVAKLRRRQSSDAVALQTEALYWQLATLKATRQTLQSAVTMLDTLSRQVKAAVDAGVAMNNDYLKVELKRNGYNADIVDADNGIRLIKMLLGQQIGLGAEAGIDIAADMPAAVPPMPYNMYVNSSEALARTNDYRMLQKNVEAKSLERRMEVGKYLPKLAVGAGWFYHDVFNQSHNFGAVMVTLEVPVSGWWGGSHAIKRKTLALDNARTELSNLGQKIEIEMSDKWDNLTAAHRKMEIAFEAIDQSKENLRLSRVYYEAGMNTITDLLDAETIYREAQDNFIAAYGAYRLSEAQYLSVTGRGAGSEAE